MKKIHHDIEFMVLRKKLDHTGSIGEKIALLEQLSALQPRNPKNLTLRRKYREELETLRVKKSNKKRSAVSLYDAIHYKRQVAVIGVTNTGKSTLINRLTCSELPVNDTPFTTFSPEVQMLSCNDVPVQLIEIPAVFDGDNDAAKYRFIRTCHVLCICAKNDQDVVTTLEQLNRYMIDPVNNAVSNDTGKQLKNSEIAEIPSFIAGWNSIPFSDLQVAGIDDPERIKELIYSLLGIKRIYFSRDVDIPDKPLVFPVEQEVTVDSFLAELDKRLLTRKKRIRVIHADEKKQDVQNAGPDYILNEGDRVEIVLH